MSRTTAIANKCHDPYIRCAFFGASQTVLGVSGSCTIAHSPQGCSLLVGRAFAWQNEDYAETQTLCTKLCEDEIVHGGESLLAQTILDAKSLNIPILFVVSACGPEIVGDDIVAVCEEMKSKVNFKIVPIECAGFKGSQYEGVDIALDVLLRKMVADGRQKIPNSVCIIAPHASANPSWIGDLAWVKNVLSKMGAQVVATLTHRTALSEFDKISAAETSIVLSHDSGEKAADYLAKEFGVEQLCKDMPLPIGFTNTQRWLTALGKSFGAVNVAESLVEAGEKMVVERCRRKGLALYPFHHESAAIIADATVGIPLVRFVTEDLEMVPKLVYLRSSRKTARNILEMELRELELDPETAFDIDVYQTKNSLVEVKPEAVFGSEIERYAIEDLDIPLIFQLVDPTTQFRLTDKQYFGHIGVLNVIEIIQNGYRDQYRSKLRRYKARW